MSRDFASHLVANLVEGSDGSGFAREIDPRSSPGGRGLPAIVLEEPTPIAAYGRCHAAAGLSKAFVPEGTCGRMGAGADATRGRPAGMKFCQRAQTLPMPGATAR